MRSHWLAVRPSRARAWGPHLASGACVVALAACGGVGSGAGFELPPSAGAPDAGDAGGAGGADGAGGGVFGDAGPTGAGEGCSAEAKLVYVLSLEGDLHSFSPAEKKFTKIAPLTCGSAETSLTPISMAVDRNAIAWVNMRGAADGLDTLYKVDVRTGDCTPSRVRGRMGGMGFSMDEGSTEKDSLFVIGMGTLMKVDFAGEALDLVSDLKEGVNLELTGTGDGRLYGFLISDPLALAAVDKTTAVFTNRVPLTNLQKPLSPMFAFSFWGGDFYFYTATDASSSTTSNVSRYRLSDGTLDTSYMTSIGFHIVGAGVSTCAPTTPPR